MYRSATLFVTITALTAVGRTEETFITIHSVTGNRITFSKSAQAERGRMQAGANAQGNAGQVGPGFGRGRGAMAGRGGMGAGRGGRGLGGGQGAAGPPAVRGPRGGRGFGGAEAQTTTVAIPVAAKITAAMRERRTFEFRVGIELAGGMRHPVFTRMQKPLSGRIVTRGNQITELNVITENTDINQRNTTSSGQTVIAVKPKRPPSK